MVITLNNLSVFYGTRPALDSLSLEVKGGAIGLLGPNGAGKSTLLKTLLGFVPPTEGSASIFGMDIQTHTLEIRQQIGYMPEDECLIPGMNAVQLVAYAGELCGMPKRDAMQRAHEVLYYVGVDEERYRPVGEYSTGMKQRVKLAQALVHDAKLLFLDEPTNGMDTSGREEMIELVKDISTDKGINTILSSHLLPDVETACEEVIALHEGRVVVHGNIEALKRQHHRAFDLKIVGNSETYVRALERNRYLTERKPGGRLRVITREDARTDETDPRCFFRLALEHGVQLRQLSEVKHSLEDIFAEAMGVE